MSNPAGVRREAREQKYRRSGPLVLYWQNRELVIENFALQTRIRTDPIAFSILHYCNGWRSVRQVAAYLGSEGGSSVREGLNRLYENGALERSDRKRDARLASMESWAPWNPSAGFFHFSSKDTGYATDQRKAMQELKRRAKQDPMPVPVKNYESAGRVQLPRANGQGEFVGVLRARRTWRKFGATTVTLEGLAQTLELTFGIQGWVDVPGLGRAALKTSPSGGCLHPIEAYVLVRNVKGARPGFYHYNAEQHELEWLRQGVTKKVLEKNIGYQWWFTKGAFLIVMTAVFGRVRWKYGFPRAYRTILMEAGHLCQTFCLTATWLGLAPFCTIALTDTQWEKWLGIDGVSESVLYVAGAGTRPAEGTRDANIQMIREGGIGARKRKRDSSHKGRAMAQGSSLRKLRSE